MTTIKENYSDCLGDIEYLGQWCEDYYTGPDIMWDIKHNEIASTCQYNMFKKNTNLYKISYVPHHGKNEKEFKQMLADESDDNIVSFHKDNPTGHHYM